MNKFHILLAIPLLWNSSLWADCSCACFGSKTRMSSQVDSIFLLNSQQTYTCATEQKEKTFLAANFKTITHGKLGVDSLIFNIPYYGKQFSFAYRWEKVDSFLPHNGNIPYYFEVHAPLSRNWAIVYVDTIMQSRQETTIFFSQVADEAINSRYRKNYKKWINVENRNCRMLLRAKQISTDSTHICFAMLTTPTIAIPLWLYRIAVSWTLPSIIMDIENKLKGNRK